MNFSTENSVNECSPKNVQLYDGRASLGVDSIANELRAFFTVAEFKGKLVDFDLSLAYQ
jgi:hypothetical protein